MNELLGLTLLCSIANPVPQQIHGTVVAVYQGEPSDLLRVYFPTLNKAEIVNYNNCLHVKDKNEDTNDSTSTVD